MPDYRTMIQQLADAYNNRDPDAFAAVFDPECDWHPVLTRTEDDPGYHGHSGIRRWIDDVDEMYEYVKFDVHFDDLRDVGDRLLVGGRLHARGRESGADFTIDVGWVVEPRGEKFHRGRGYPTYDEARRAVEVSASQTIDR